MFIKNLITKDNSRTCKRYKAATCLLSSPERETDDKMK